MSDINVNTIEQTVVVDVPSRAAHVVSTISPIEVIANRTAAKLTPPTPQPVNVNPSGADIVVVHQTQQIVVDPDKNTFSVVNAGPIGSRGPVGPAWPSTILDDGDLLTKTSGDLAPISRPELADALAAEAPFLALVTPPGVVNMFAGLSAPTGWLLCDGSSQLRTSYPDLFAAIDVTYGSVDGTHFNLPDLRGRTPIGVGTGAGLSVRDLADTGGEETHTLSAAESGVPAHTHANTATTSATSHTHAASSDNESAHTHDGSPLKAQQSTAAGANNVSGRASSSSNQGTVTNTVNIVGSTGAGTAHNHAITVSAESAHVHDVNVTNVANTAASAANAHNNMQPWLALNFIIKT